MCHADARLLFRTEQKTMKIRSLAALATIRARIARRRRAAWAHHDGSRAAGRVTHEREVQSLSESSGAPPAAVRALFAAEFARLKVGAKVGSYLAVLTESNVRGMLRRKAEGPPSVSRTC